MLNALLTNLNFGKGESQTANHSLSFDSLMSTTLFIYLLHFLLLIQKHFTTISIDYCKSKTKKNIFLKNYRVFNKNVLSAFIQKIGYWMQNEQKLRQHKLLVDSNKRVGKFWARQRNREWYFLRFFTSVGQRKNSFFVPRFWQDFFIELKTYHLSYYYLQTLCYRYCWSWQYAGPVWYELRNRLAHRGVSVAQW